MTGLRPCAWTAARCREVDFQKFIGADSEESAAARVRELCEIDTRAQLDREPAAQARWNQQIRIPFLKYQQKNQPQDQEI